MSETIRLRSDLPFPAAGEGVVLRFTNADCDALQKKFGDNWFTDAIMRTNRFDMVFLRECIMVGAKKDGKTFKVDFDNLQCPGVEVAEVVLDGLFLTMHGRKFEDHLNYLDSLKSVNAGDDQGKE